jgi:hypothetical protein
VSVERRKQEWVEIPSRSFREAAFKGSPVRIYRNGERLMFAPAPDVDIPMVFDISELGEALNRAADLPADPPDGALFR